MAESAHSLTQYQAPILGVGASVRLRGGHVDLGTLDEFGSGLAEGFTLGIDCQPEAIGEHELIGSASSGRTAILVSYIVKPSQQKIRIRIRDDGGRNLIASAALSLAAGKRLIIRIDPPRNVVRISESTIRTASELDLDYSRADRPSEFSNLNNSLTLSGFSHDGRHTGRFVGRAANVFLFSTCLGDQQVKELSETTAEEIHVHYGVRPSITKSAERREVFTEDLSRLRDWVSKQETSDAEARDASTMLHKWLFDPHPLLADICDELGVQLSFPCQTKEATEYMEKLVAMKPSFYQVGVHGTRAPHGHVWQPLRHFGDEIAFRVEGHSVSHRSFVKLVRHKLGGAHLDIKDRKKWQRDLKAYSERIRLSGSQAINFQMRALLEAVHEAVEGNGIESQLQLQP